MHSKKLAISLLACALVIWLGFAYAHHQTELHHEPHPEHICQLFSVAKHGSSFALPVVAVLLTITLAPLQTGHPLPGRSVTPQQARSPPCFF